MITLNAEHLAQTHYENFPVTPFFLPRKLKKAIAHIYAFARVADDLADEGNDPSALRLERLNLLEAHLKNPTHPFFKNLSQIIEAYHLPLPLFFDLLKAFKQDVIQSRYETFEDLREYCRYSAEPIGALMPYLFNQFNEQTLFYSNQICAGLQLINFLQDFHLDLIHRNRLYIPQADLKQHDVTENELRLKQDTPAIRNLLDQQWQRAYHIFESGSPLSKYLNGQLKWIILMTLQSGNRVLHKIKKSENLFERPTLSPWDRLIILIRSIA